MSYKSIAIIAAKESGEILKNYFRKPIQVKFKARKDLVSSADIESEKKIFSIIRKNFPAHSIRGEELPAHQTSSPYKWLFDLLDGTTNYIAGIPLFHISIALTYKNKTVLAVVYDPMRDELFCAEKNKGAYLNGQKIAVNNNSQLEDSLISYSRSYHPTIKTIKLGTKIFKKLLPKVRAIRQFGTTAIDFCYVASGKLDATITTAIARGLEHPAGCFILDEAGGKSTDFSDKKWNLESKNIIATNNKIHKVLLKILKE